MQQEVGPRASLGPLSFGTSGQRGQEWTCQCLLSIWGGAGIRAEDAALAPVSSEVSAREEDLCLAPTQSRRATFCFAVTKQDSLPSRSRSQGHGIGL